MCDCNARKPLEAIALEVTDFGGKPGPTAAAQIAIAALATPCPCGGLQEEYVSLLDDRNKLLAEFQSVRAERDRLREENERLKRELQQRTESLHLAVRLKLQAQEDLASLRTQLMDWENREAAICPEDVGFEELIRSLRSQLAAANELISALPKSGDIRATDEALIALRRAAKEQTR